MQPKAVAVRKRTQIAKANRTMFIWVACASALIGFAIVVCIFLAQMLFYNEKVLSEKDKTVAVLKTNNTNIIELQNQVRALDANQALIDAKARPEDRAIQVILDALPSEANSLALGASLQNKLLTGVSLSSLQVDSAAKTSGSAAKKNEILFRFSVSGDEAVLKQTLNNLEKSIRTIEVISLKIENQGATRVMTVQAKAYYEPARLVELKDKTVK
jgi:cell division protein FtsB